jgi:hypothetical protein
MTLHNTTESFESDGLEEALAEHRAADPDYDARMAALEAFTRDAIAWYCQEHGITESELTGAHWLWVERDYEKHLQAVEREKRQARRNGKANGASEPSSNYGANALADQCAEMAATPEGSRNDFLNRSAVKMASLVAAGVLDEQTARDALYDAAIESGLTHRETLATIESGMRHGLTTPRDIEPLPEYEGAKLVFLRDSEDGEFWTSRPELEHVRDYARAKRVSPWATLGVVLARVVTAVPHGVVLPGVIGSEASLNLFVALVGPSGGGKGASERAAADAVKINGNVETATIGSGEGIAHLYAHRVPKTREIERDRTAVLFTIPEVDSLTALGHRQGATLLPELRKAWSGEALGFSYADPAKRLPIAAHSYRLCLVVGVQPGRAGALLDDTDGGTPQRFLWLPTTDADAPDVTPEAPTPLGWEAPPLGARVRESYGRVVMGIPDEAREVITSNRLVTLRTGVPPLDAHAPLNRLKIAAALALFAGRLDVTADDWELAGVIMGVSDATRTGVVTHLSRERSKVNKARAEAEGDRAVIVESKRRDADTGRVAQGILRAVKKRPDGSTFTRRDLARLAAGRDRRAHAEPAIDALIAAGELAELDGHYSLRVAA